VIRAIEVDQRVISVIHTHPAYITAAPCDAKFLYTPGEVHETNPPHGWKLMRIEVNKLINVWDVMDEFPTLKVEYSVLVDSTTVLI
jgi:hypothetical protein